MNPSKQKGTAWERQVRDYFRATGWNNCERLPSEGSKDRGDLANLPLTVEVKATRIIDLAGALTEAQKEAVNANHRWYCAIHKRRLKPVQDAYVTLPLSIFVGILQALPKHGETG